MTTPKPIFIVGTGRSGSTLLYSILSQHPQTAFITSLLDRYPMRTGWNRWIVDHWTTPLVGPALRSRTTPSEGWNYWERFVPGFRRWSRDAVRNDATEEMTRGLTAGLRELPTKASPVPIIKYTGWTRIQLIKRVFPNARIIHLVRDPRDVANSLTKMPWWLGWRGPDQWRWGPLSRTEESVWNAAGQSYPVLAAIAWHKIELAHKTNFAGLTSNEQRDVIDIRFESLYTKKERTLDAILDFTGLDIDSDFARYVSKLDVRNEDGKWMKNWSAETQLLVDEALGSLGWSSDGLERLDTVEVTA